MLAYFYAKPLPSGPQAPLVLAWCQALFRLTPVLHCLRLKPIEDMLFPLGSNRDKLKLTILPSRKCFFRCAASNIVMNTVLELVSVWKIKCSGRLSSIYCMWRKSTAKNSANLPPFQAVFVPSYCLYKMFSVKIKQMGSWRRFLKGKRKGN